MFAVEFSSSSSDDDLERELIRQRRRDDLDEQHIVRAASAYKLLTPQSVLLPSGRRVEVRKGSIYIPVRDIYVHTIDAKRHPAWFFGDGGLRRHRRPPVAPESVQLYAVRGGKRTRHESEVVPLLLGDDFTNTPVVTLCDASNADFLIFKEVTAGYTAPVASTSPINEDREEAQTMMRAVLSNDSTVSVAAITHSNFRASTELSHTRFDGTHATNVEDKRGFGTVAEAASNRISQRPPGTPLCQMDSAFTPFACVSAQYTVDHRLSVVSTQSWATENRRVPVDGRHAFFTHDNCDQVFFYNALTRSVGRFWCELEDDVLHTEQVQQLDGVVPQKDLVGTAAFASDHVVGYTLIGRHFITSALQSVSAAMTTESSASPLHVFKGAVATGCPYACWCQYRGTSLPSLAVSAEHDLFECTMRPTDGVWERRLLRRFVNTPPTALCTVGWRSTSTGQAPAALVSGMRNGTVQLTPLQTSSSHTGGRGGGFFDATPRHASASVVSMHALPDREFDVVTVASTGEAKLWDVRHLSGNRDPVLTLCGPRVDAGTVAAFSGHLVAVATRTASLVCVDALTGTVVADIQEDMPETPDRCCVARAESEYQVYLLKDRRVHRIVLSPS